MNKFILLIAVLLYTTASFAGTPVPLDHSHLALTLLSFFGIGVLLAFTPCVLPMIPILSSVLMGEEQISMKRSFQLSLTFVLSMAFTYALAGLAAGYLGRTVQTILQQPWVIISFALIFVMMALSMFGLFNLSLPQRVMNYLHMRSNQQQRGRFTGVAVMGFLSTLIASPCVTAPLISVLIYISQTGNSFLGGLILFVMALGMGLPLLLFGMGQGYLVPKAGVWMTKVKYFFGIMMLGLAVWMISRLLSDLAGLTLWGIYLIISSILIAVLDRRSEQRMPAVLYAVLLSAGLYGVWLTGHTIQTKSLVGGSSVSEQIIRQSSQVEPASLFSLVHDNQEMDMALQNAKTAHQPVLIEFFASWCSDCRRVDKEIFSDPVVQKKLRPFSVIRVDVTRETDPVIALKDRYQIYAIPTIIFYDRNGRRFEDNEFIEEIGKDGFIKQLVALGS